MIMSSPSALFNTITQFLDNPKYNWMEWIMEDYGCKDNDHHIMVYIISSSDQFQVLLDFCRYDETIIVSANTDTYASEAQGLIDFSNFVNKVGNLMNDFQRIYGK
jgi:hypothetical protein